MSSPSPHIPRTRITAKGGEVEVTHHEGTTIVQTAAPVLVALPDDYDGPTEGPERVMSTTEAIHAVGRDVYDHARQHGADLSLDQCVADVRRARTRGERERADGNR